jgi:hypothetical protein
MSLKAIKKMKCQKLILDQLKTLILIKGGERNVGSSLPSFIFSHTFVSISFLLYLRHRAALLTNILSNFMSGQKDIFLFGTLPVIFLYRKKP